MGLRQKRKILKNIGWAQFFEKNNTYIFFSPIFVRVNVETVGEGVNAKDDNSKLF